MPVKRILASAAVLAVFFLWVYAGLLPWRAERLTAAIAAGEVPADDIPLLPLADEPPRRAARVLLQDPDSDNAVIERYLERSLALRPLYAPTWADRAQLAMRMGDRAAADRYLQVARELWPTRARLLLRVALMRLDMGDVEGAFDVLRDYVRSRPQDLTRVVQLARQYEPEPARFVPALLPAEPPAGQPPQVYAAMLLGFARQSKDTALARVAWQATPEAGRREAALVFPFIDHMVAVGEGDLALAAWSQYSGAEAELGALVDGGFEAPLAGGGFGWRRAETAGARAERDAEVRYEGTHSLRVEFDGTTNVHYYHVRQMVPVQSGARYRMSGHWRGDGVTTRSGVFVDVRALGGTDNAVVRSDAERASWEWAPFALEFDAADDTRFVEVRVRRNRSDALDNKIAGRVWLDALRLDTVVQP